MEVGIREEIACGCGRGDGGTLWGKGPLRCEWWGVRELRGFDPWGEFGGGEGHGPGGVGWGWRPDARERAAG